MTVHTTKNKPKTFDFIHGPMLRSWQAIMVISLLAYGVISWLILRSADTSNLHFRIDMTPFLTSALVLKIHVMSALSTFAVGVVLLSGLPKGTRTHKQLGWAWVITMFSTAVSSFFLIGLNGGHFSWIHGLSAWTVISLPFAVYAARRHDVKKHSNTMRGMFFGGMIIAGLFSFLPGRMMWRIFFAL